MDFVDLHTHILPGVDDGAEDEADSLAMIRGLADLGFATVCATPHQKAGQFLPDLGDIDSAFATCSAAVATQLPAVRLILAAENTWDSVFYERAEAGTVPGYQGTRAFLVELPNHQLPVGLFERMFRFRRDGLLPVIAHPERYEPLMRSREQTERLAQMCPMVIDLPALTGEHGRRVAKFARALVREGLAHAATSDAHSVADVERSARGIHWIRKKMGDAAVQRLLGASPRRILAGQHPDD